MTQGTTQLTAQQLRQGFLDAAIVRSQTLPRQAYSAGGEISFNLPHAGYAIGVLLDFQGTLTITGSGGTLALSDKAPYNLFNEVQYDDYLGINRVKCSGYDLHERLLSLKYLFDENNSVLAQAYASNRFNVSIGGGNGAAGSYPLNFSTMVPVALHENDPRGSYPLVIPNGDNTITVDFNSLVGSNNDFVIKQTVAGFTVTLTGTVGATYYYWDVPAGTPLPVQDFALVHELRRVKDTTGITAGNEKRYTLRTGRTYYQVIENFRNGDAGDTADITEIDFFINGDTSTLSETLMAYLTRTYNKHGRDLPPGMFVWDFWKKPWTPNDYGSLETSLTISNGATISGTNTYLSVFTEAMYQTNKILADLATLPGGQQA